MATETTAGTLIEGLPLPVVVVARDARVIEANPLAVALFGEAILGRHHGLTFRSPDLLAAIEAALVALDLEPLRHRPVSQLSGGERARVLLARVLAGEPRWILADEPLAALDLAHQLSLVAHLKACARPENGAAQGVVVVLHDLGLAMNHADRVLVMKGGRLIADGTQPTALAPQVIAQGWGVRARWLGDPGAQALIAAEEPEQTERNWG